MIALSIRQPWASFIITGVAGRFKDIENRDWSAPFRGRLLVHASKNAVKKDFAAAIASVEEALGIDIDMPFDAFPRGGVIGSVEVFDCVDASSSPWFVGPHGFLLREPRGLAFMPFRGQLSFFNVPGVSA